MNRFRRLQGLAMGTMLLALILTVGCARPAGLQSNDNAAQADQNQLPFHDEVAKSPDNTHPADAGVAHDNDLKTETALPFHDPQNLPAGTLLTVRLKNPISAENPGANGTFEAVIDEPVVIEGNKLLPRGAIAAGRVESVRSSKLKRNGGYVRLALNSIHVSGSNLNVRTASLFVRGNVGEPQLLPGDDSPDETGPSLIRLEKGRRLTFRLTEPVFVAGSQRTATAH